MVEVGPVQSVEALLAHPVVGRAKCVELSICDAVHFRLLRPDPVFAMTELRLQERHPGKFAGFAACRAAVDRAMRGAPIKDKIDACCTRQPQWLDDRQVLYSTELEVWMDLSYPNPWTLGLYHKVLLAGKAVTIPHVGPFSDTFYTLLKEKNGYELTQPAGVPGATVHVHVGEQTYLNEPYLQLVTHLRESRPHPFGRAEELASQLAFGILQKDLEDSSARQMDAQDFQSRSLGSWLVGPTLVLLLQALNRRPGTVAFIGDGADYLSGLLNSLRAAWPWLPPLGEPGARSLRVGLWPTPDHSVAPQEALYLLPNPLLPDRVSVVGLESCEPVALLLPAMSLFLRAAFKGSAADKIQKGATWFAREYAGITRGMDMSLPAAPVLRHWRQTVLGPEAALLEWAAEPGRLPGFRKARHPWELLAMVRGGPWPTGSHALSGPLGQWWLGRQCRDEVRRIDAARGVEW